jgi:phosphatidylglycerol:prolipoprotein diacylglycerol transferase
MLLVFLFLLWLHKHKRFSGQVVLTYALLYSTIRFAIEFVRDDPRGDILGLTSLTGLSTSQLISLVIGICALIILIIRENTNSHNLNSDRQRKLAEPGFPAAERKAPAKS